VRGTPAALLLPAVLLLGFLSPGGGGSAHAPDPAGPGAAATAPADPCADFSWDVRRERALFGEVPQKLSAGASAADAPAMSPDRLYELALVPHSQVRFVATPGRSRSTAGHAGLATLSLPSAGLYRIALDQPFWVDVIAHGTSIPSRDFQGRRGCHAPHKVVEFVLPAATPLTLQFSDGDTATLRVAVLMAPQPSVHGEDHAVRLDQCVCLAALLQLQTPRRVRGDHRHDLDTAHDAESHFRADRSTDDAGDSARQ
jgi:hypothetical protein